MTRRSTLCFTCMISASAVAVALLFVTNGIVKLGNAPDADGSLALRALALESRAELRALRQAERGVAEGLVELRSLVAASSKASGGASASVAPGDVIEQHIEGKPLYLLKTCPADRPTKEWSCVRRLSASAVASRDPALYGFNATEAAHVPFTDGGRRYRQGDTREYRFDDQIATQIRVTGGPGYALMDMPEGLCSTLRFGVEEEDAMGAGEIEELNERGNDYVIPYRMRWLSEEAVHRTRALVTPIMERWTGQALSRGTVFGTREYAAHTFLTNHVDNPQVRVHVRVRERFSAPPPEPPYHSFSVSLSSEARTLTHPFPPSPFDSDVRSLCSSYAAQRRVRDSAGRSGGRGRMAQRTGDAGGRSYRGVHAAVPDASVRRQPHPARQANALPRQKVRHGIRPFHAQDVDLQRWRTRGGRRKCRDAMMRI